MSCSASVQTHFCILMSTLDEYCITSTYSLAKERKIMATKLIAKTVAITMAAAMLTTTMLPISSANAGHRKHHRKNHHNGEIIGAGIIGLALGAIIIGSAEHRRRRADRIYQELPAYRPPEYVNGYQPEYYEGPEVIVERPYREEYNDNQPEVLPDYHRKNDNYNNTRRHRKSRKSEPRVITYDQAMNQTSLTEPWTPAWLSYCRSKFRSFNASSGTFLGFDGKRHFCVPK